MRPYRIPPGISIILEEEKPTARSLTSILLRGLLRQKVRPFALPGVFVGGESAPSRGDWSDRLDDLRDRLVFHTMNEWMDSLPDELKEQSAAIALRHYPADAVSGEIYRFVRDFAYAYLQEGDKDSPTAKEFKRRALDYLYLARLAEEDPSFSEKNERYRAMKDIALCHLNDGGLLEPSGMSSHDIDDDAERGRPFRGLIARLMRTRLMVFVKRRNR